MYCPRWPGHCAVYKRHGQVVRLPHVIWPFRGIARLTVFWHGEQGLMFSKQLKRVLAVTASAVVVLGGTGAAMAAGSPVAAAGANTTYYACVLTAGSHQFFPWHALWN